MLSHFRRKGIYVSLLLLAIVPFFLKSPYYMHLLNMFGISILLTMGLNIIIGYGGQFALAQAAFYAFGAYASALLTIHTGMSFWMALVLSGFFTVLVGLFVGIPSLMVKGHYLAILTLGLAVVIHETILNWMELTKGPQGITNIPQPDLFGFRFDTDHKYFYIIFIVTLLGILFARKMIHSRTGRALVALRDSYIAAEAMGINTTYYKVLAFAVSAFYAGIAGSLYAHLVTYISPEMGDVSELLTVFAMMMLGGIGTIGGPILGAAVITFGNEYLRVLGDLRMVFYGLMILLLVIYLPNGLIVLWDRVRFRVVKE
jgi:branched-chain amino acid transport system permease protein